MTSFSGYYEVAKETGSLKQSHSAIQQNNDPVSKWLIPETHKGLNVSAYTYLVFKS